jgi:CHAT domain-containing protein
VARSEVGLSQALVGAGDFAAAIEAATRARHIAIALGSDDMLWRALTAEARAVRKIGDVPRALGVARASVAVLDRLQAEALDKPGSSLTAEAAGALATFAVLQAESGQAAGAFATSERLRTIEIRAGLATNERDIARGMTEEERAEERTLAAAVLTRLAQVTRERTLPKPDAARVATLDAAVAEARTARREWMRRLFERLPALQTWRGLGAPRLVVDAAPLLTGPAELVVSFVLDDDDLLAMTIARQETEAGVTPALEIEAHVTHVNRRHVNASVLAIQQAAALNDANAWKTAMSEVVALLPPALQSRLAAASKVTILPHDVLWRVPFEALPLQDRLLGDRTSVSIAGSLDSTIRGAAIASRQTGPRLLAVGAPQLVPGRLARYKQVAPGWNLRGAESADPELSAVSSAYDAALVTTLSRAMATETAVREQLTAQAVHVAAPFRINAASPLFSSMLLSTMPPPEGAAAEPSPSAAPGAGSTPAAQPGAGSASLPPRPELASNDGALELREVMNLDSGARIVVFSDGAATSMRDGASAADVLQWGWLAAGVPSLLVARWSAPPTTGPTLLAEFHKQIASGARPADALRAAQALIRSSANTAAPIYWAGWMLLGPQ